MSDPKLTLKQLRYLIALADSDSFRRAAQRCGVSQPSLSVQLQNLEAVLGVRLVERERSGVTLTPVGRGVVERGRRILLDVQGMMDFATAALHGMAGTIRLGVMPTLGPYLLPNVVVALHKQHPDLKLYIREGAPSELASELERGLHDVILAQLPVHGTDLVTERLFREPIFFAVEAGHALARQEAVSIDDLADLPVLSMSPDFHLHDQVHALCEDFGARLVRDYEGTSLDALRQMVAMEMGASFFPALYVHSEFRRSSNVVARPLKGRPISRSIGLVWRKGAGRAPAYSEMAGIIRTVARESFDTLTIEG